MSKVEDVTGAHWLVPALAQLLSCFPHLLGQLLGGGILQLLGLVVMRGHLKQPRAVNLYDLQETSKTLVLCPKHCSLFSKAFYPFHAALTIVWTVFSPSTSCTQRG